MIRGVVGRTFAKDFGQGNFYSFTVKGQDGFFRTGKRKPPEEGSSIQFEVDDKNNVKNLVPWTEGNAASGVPARAVVGSVSGPNTADQFWRNKEVRDVETQKRIELQSCRNSALEFVSLLLSEGIAAVKMPAKQADKVGVVEELLAHYTKKFLDENKTGLETKPAAEKIDESISQEAVTEKEEQKNVDADWT